MKKYTGWLVVVAAVALILLSAQWQYRVDLTAEQRYTVSNASEQLLQQLGKHKMGKACLYIKRLADLDIAVLKQLAVNSVAELQRRYGPAASC